MRLHHVGVVVRNVPAYTDDIRARFGIEQCYGPVIDEAQEVELAMILPPGGIWIEVLRPTTSTSPAVARSTPDGRDSKRTAWSSTTTRTNPSARRFSTTEA